MGFGKDGSGQMVWMRNNLQALGTLASEAAIVFEFTESSNMIADFRMMKIEYALKWQGKSVDDGPIVIGLSVGATAAQIAEAMNSTPTDPTQLDEGNDANRPIWPLMIIRRKATEPVDGTVDFKSFKPNWSTRGSSNANGQQNLGLWAFNSESGALTTGVVIGAEVKVAGAFVNVKGL